MASKVPPVAMKKMTVSNFFLPMPHVFLNKFYLKEDHQFM